MSFFFNELTKNEEFAEKTLAEREKTTLIPLSIGLLLSMIALLLYSETMLLTIKTS